MLKPSYFYGKTDKIVSYYQDIEDYLLSDIAKFLLNSNKIGGKADRELYILNNMGMNDREVVKRLSSLTKKSRNEVRRLLKDSVMTSFSSDKAVLEKLITDIKPPMQNNNILKILDAEWKKTNGELDNLTRTTMRGYQDTLLKSLNDVSLLTDSGVMSHEEACCKVIDKMGKDGLVIDYPTGAKRTLEAAVRCAVVTSMNQTAAQTTNGYIAEGGFEYVLITAHSGARHDDRGGLYSHDEWQGKAYKIRGSEKGFPNLADSTGYDIDPVTGMGTVVNPHGLHGYNCRHSHQPWIKGLDNPWVDDKGRPIINKKESIERYENEQKQRAYERSIRQTKRELLLKQEEINNVDSDIYKAELQAQYDKKAYRLSQQQKAYNAFSDSVGLPTQANRTKTGGFGKHESAVARGRARAYGNALNETEMKSGNVIKASQVRDIIPDKRDYNAELADILINAHNVHLSINNMNGVIWDKDKLHINSGDAFNIPMDLGTLDNDMKQAVIEQLGHLTELYDTTLDRVRMPQGIYEKQGMFKSYARTWHNYEVDNSEMILNPVLMNDKNRLIENIRKGWAVSIDEALADKYVITHEFAHTLVDMRTPLNSKRNFLGADYKKVKSVRTQIEDIYERYMKAVEEAETNYKGLELKFIMGEKIDPADYAKAKETLQNIKISNYSLDKSDEFMAEAFTKAILVDQKNPFVKEVMDVLNANFRKGK